MKTYNESLPSNAKILDANGRMVDPSKMTGKQIASIEDIFQGSENQARRNLSDRMRTTYERLVVFY